MQSNPGIHLSELGRQLLETRLYGFAAEEIELVTRIQTIRTGVLGDDQQFAHTGVHQVLCFGEHLAHRAAHEITTHARDDAEAAAMVAAFGYFQISVMPGGELDTDLRLEIRGLRLNARRWHQVDKGIVPWRQMLVHRAHHFAIGLRTGDGKYARVCLTDQLAIVTPTQTARHDHFAILDKGFADRIQRLFRRRIDKSTGIHDDQFGILIIAR